MATQTKTKKTAERADAGLAEKRRTAAELNKYQPAVMHKGNGEVVTFTDEQIAQMTTTECDAVIANIIRRRSVGNQAKFPNVESLERAIQSYWVSVFEQRSKGLAVIPDVEHLCSYLGVSRRTLMEWKRENRNNFGDTLETAFNDIAAVKNQLALHGDINAMVWTVMMNNNHGYTQNAKLEVTSKSADSVPSADTLIGEINRLLEDE